MNLSAWSSVPEPSGDSSILKIQAFLGRLKAVTPSNSAALCADIHKYKLVKYQTEICDGMVASAIKAKSLSDVNALIQVQSAIHQTIGGQYSLLSVPKILKAVQATGRQRTLARLTLELYFNDLLPPASSKSIVSKMLAKLEPSGSTLKVLLAYPLGDLLLDYIPRVEQWVLESEPPAKTDLMLSDELQRIDDKKLELEEATRLCLEAKGENTTQPATTSATSEPLVESIPTPTSAPAPAPVPTPAAAPPNSTIAAATPPRWSQYEQKLTNMSSAEQVSACIASFSADPSTFTKTQSLLLESPRMHMLKWYALFLSQIPELAAKVCPIVLSRYENPTYLRYTAELVKVGALKPEVAVDILIKLSTPVLKPSLCFVFSEACGGYLAQCDQVVPRLKSYSEFLRKQPANTQDRTLMDGTIEYLSNTDTLQQSEDRNLAGFVKLLLYRELDKRTYPRVLKLVKKLKQGELLNMYGLFCDLSIISSETIPLVANLIVQLSMFCPEFGVRVLNTLLDSMHSEKQLQVSHAMMLGELQPLLVPQVIDYVFKGFLEVPSVPYRLKLASIFVSHMRGLESSYLACLKEYRAGVELEVGSEIIAVFERAVEILSSSLAPRELLEEEEEQDQEEQDQDEQDEEEQEQEQDQDQDEPEEQDEDLELELVPEEIEEDEDSDFLAAFAQAQKPASGPTFAKPSVPYASANTTAPKGLLDISKLRGLAPNK